MGNNATWVKCYFYHFISVIIHGINEHDLSLMILNMIPCPRSCSPSFSTRKLLFPIFLYSIFGKQAIKESPHETGGRGGTKLHLLERELFTKIIWNFTVRKCCFSHIYLFIQLFIYISMNLWKFILCIMINTVLFIVFSNFFQL